MSRDEPRDVLLVGGFADGRRMTILHGDSLLLEDKATGDRVLYMVAQLAGSKQLFHFGVPSDRALDGDWLIDQLATAYEASR